MIRRRGLGLAALLLPTPGWAQRDWPARPVRIVVPSAPGGGTDMVARLLAERLGRALGQAFVVENRPGAGQMIGIEAVARAAPDGYTLLMAASTLVLNGLLFRNVSYDPVRDFAPVTQVAVLPNVLLVNPALPARSVAALIALAQARPGALTYASAGIGTSPHMAMELFRSMAGITLEHVAYRGTTPAFTDLLAGRVDAMMANVLTARPAIEAGTLRPLGVTGLTRVAGLPEVPPIAETLPGYEAPQWYGLLAPAGTPGPIVARLQAEAAHVLAEAEIRERLAADGAEPVGSTPEAFAQMIAADLARWTRVAREANIRPE